MIPHLLSPRAEFSLVAKALLQMDHRNTRILGATGIFQIERHNQVGIWCDVDAVEVEIADCV